MLKELIKFLFIIIFMFLFIKVILYFEFKGVRIGFKKSIL